MKFDIRCQAVRQQGLKFEIRPSRFSNILKQPLATVVKGAFLGDTVSMATAFSHRSMHNTSKSVFTISNLYLVYLIDAVFVSKATSLKGVKLVIHFLSHFLSPWSFDDLPPEWAISHRFLTITLVPSEVFWCCKNLCVQNQAFFHQQIVTPLAKTYTLKNSLVLSFKLDKCLVI